MTTPEDTHTRVRVYAVHVLPGRGTATVIGERLHGRAWPRPLPKRILVCEEDQTRWVYKGAGFLEPANFDDPVQREAFLLKPVEAGSVLEVGSTLRVTEDFEQTGTA